MKALSVGLVKGSIDEVDKRVHMTWVQPRVLDLQQVIMVMRHPFSAWPGVLGGESLSLGGMGERRRSIPFLYQLLCFM